MADLTDKISLEIESGAKTADNGISKLIKDLKELHNNMDITADGTESLAQQLKDLGVDLNYSKLKSTLTKQSSDILQYTTASGKLLTINRKIKDNNAEYVTSLKSVNTVLDNAKTSMKTFIPLQEQLSKLGVVDIDLKKPTESFRTLTDEMYKYKTRTGETVTITKKLVDGETVFNVSVKKTNNSLNERNSVLSALTKGISGLIVKGKIILGTLKDMAFKMADIVEGASEYEEALNLFVVSMGDKAEEATAWVERFSTALYLDPRNVMQYMGSLNSLISGLGVGSDNSYKMSKNLTQLAYDLSSFKNMKFEEAFRKIQSGISGEIEPLILAAIIRECYRKCSELIHIRCDNKCYC